jgi:type I restriction enzyme S subunit
MMWEKVKLGDIASFSNGINFNKTAYEKGVKLIGVSNFGDRFYPDYLQLQEVKKDIVRPEDCLRNGDIVFVRSNGNKELVGRCMLVKNPTERVTYSGFCIRARLNDTDRYDPVYFTYYFKSKAFRRAVSGTAVGANIQNLSQARLSNHDCNVPDIETQHRIADILSAYDDLIENNQKQIKLLEEAAQRLYKEWFVDLHFPGHENTKIVDGVPEGWHRGTVGQIAEFKRGRTITKAQVKGGNVPVVAGGLEPAYYHNVANTKAPVITISASGANAGFVRLYGVDVFASDCSFVDGLGTESLFFVYEFLKESKVSIDQLQKGSAQPHVYAKDINAMKITIPEKEYLERFDRYAKVYFNKIKTLQGQNERLKTARNLLLAKLMSGEVEV